METEEPGSPGWTNAERSGLQSKPREVYYSKKAYKAHKNSTKKSSTKNKGVKPEVMTRNEKSSKVQTQEDGYTQVNKVPDENFNIKNEEMREKKQMETTKQKDKKAGSGCCPWKKKENVEKQTGHERRNSGKRDASKNKQHSRDPSLLSHGQSEQSRDQTQPSRDHRQLSRDRSGKAQQPNAKQTKIPIYEKNAKQKVSKESTTVKHHNGVNRKEASVGENVRRAELQAQRQVLLQKQQKWEEDIHRQELETRYEDPKVFLMEYRLGADPIDQPIYSEVPDRIETTGHQNTGSGQTTHKHVEEEEQVVSVDLPEPSPGIELESAVRMNQEEVKEKRNLKPGSDTRERKKHATLQVDLPTPRENEENNGIPTSPPMTATSFGRAGFGALKNAGNVVHNRTLSIILKNKVKCSLSETEFILGDSTEVMLKLGRVIDHKDQGEVKVAQNTIWDNIHCVAVYEIQGVRTQTRDPWFLYVEVTWEAKAPEPVYNIGFMNALYSEADPASGASKPDLFRKLRLGGVRRIKPKVTVKRGLAQADITVEIRAD